MPENPKREIRFALRPVLINAVVAGLLVAGIVGGTMALHVKASTKPEVAPLPALPVAVHRISIQDSYTVEETFSGRLEPAREAALSFERQGLILAIRVDEGDDVVEGQVLAELDTAPLAAARRGLVAERRQREAELKLARLTTNRQAALHRKGHASAQRYDEARLSVQALNAAIARVDSAIAAIDIDLAKSVLRAPFDGRIAERRNDEGDIASPVAPTLTLMEADTALVRIGLPPAVAAKLTPGETTQLTIGGQPVSGRLKALRPDLSPSTRTVSSLFEVEKNDRTPYGEIVRFFVSREITARGAWIPVSALTEGLKGLWSISTLVTEDAISRAGMEAVEVLHVDRDRVYVRGSFADGVQIVANGLNRIAPGQTVAVIEAQ